MSVARDDGDVPTSNGEDGVTVVAERVEVTLLRCGLAAQVRVALVLQQFLR